ncbi:hypothetical protein [Pseudomonas sp. FSL R10-2172]|uniref:hypothetical protein n=1 Tax=Pseudomonas sp. FSL R10-2172 TaxID=2662198 RepID=UPI0021144B40|nr:hypothetical protein [Pseudomonas sp. FSL R10-2172]
MPLKPGTTQFAFLADRAAARRQGIGIATEEPMPCPQPMYPGVWSALVSWPQRWPAAARPPPRRWCQTP